MTREHAIFIINEGIFVHVTCVLIIDSAYGVHKYAILLIYTTYNQYTKEILHKR